MSIRFRCPNCTASIGVDHELNSERIECPRCRAALFVPDPTAAASHAGKLPVAEEAPVDFGSKREQPEVDIDMTPMVDVTFLLLIFFMVTAAFSLQKSFQIPTPKEERPSAAVVTIDDFEEDPEFVIVRIDENSTFYVTASHWDEEREVPSRQDLLVGLKDARTGGDRIPTKLLVIAHGNAWHEKVVMAMDAGTDVGMTEVKLVTVEDDQS